VLVIDASVAQAAGWSDHPESSASRHFLRGVLDICHRMVLTPPLIEEWRRHQSSYTREWRKIHVRPEEDPVARSGREPCLRKRVLDPGAGALLLEIRLKDLPLIEAALCADHIVVSLDEEARQSFRLRELNIITWVNPLRERDHMGSWLEDGAPPVEEWKLGWQG
jgi:hypothetical protein